MSDELPADLLSRARAWASDDPDPVTRAALEGLLERAPDDDAAAADLADRFDGTLEFGTAGLRGAQGAGPNRMNRAVVLRAAAGLAAYLRDHGAGEADTVVVGYDARHNSDVFARDTAEVVTGAGMRALVLPRPLPTPLLAFAVRDLGCAAGVMVTASHNPARDNGYKVYLGAADGGSQIVPPADAGIAERIAAVGAVADIPRGEGGEVLGDDLVDRYLDAVAGLVGPGPDDAHPDAHPDARTDAHPDARTDLSVVYTPLHGVGRTTVETVLERAGFSVPHVVVRQGEPDPEFPTVAFPNPEEPGAMDLATELATQVGADVVVANDPDADRCAVAVPTGPTGHGGWSTLSGDEVGALLADHLLRSGREGTYAASIVSSSLLGELARAAGQPHAETLTGFKWISRVEGLTYGYEEALGYCVDPDHVRDKDGISALLLVCELAASLKAEGLTLRDNLDRIAREHGLFATDQLSVRFSDLDRIPATPERLRSTPPASLGGLAVEAVDDLAHGSARGSAQGSTGGSGGLPPTDGLRFRLADRARVVVRPSGTEPKIKCYLEVVVPVGEEQDGVDAARIAAAGRLDAIRGDLRAAAGL